MNGITPEKVREQQQSLANKVALLSQQVETEISQTERLKEEVSQLQWEMDDTETAIQTQLDELHEEWRVIVEKRKALESNNLQGDLGMLAVYVEQAMCTHVMPEVFWNDDGASLHRLLDYLNTNNLPLPLDPSKYNCERILSEARKRWEIMCEIFNFPNEWKTKSGEWKPVYDCNVPGDIRAIEVLKMGGVNINFPSPVSLKYAEQNVESMKEELAPWQFELVGPFIGSLRDKMTRSGLHHNNLILD